MKPLTSAVLILIALQIPLSADELELADGGKLNGVVRSITPNGIITADLAITDEPAEILADKVSRVRFGKAIRNYGHDTMLTLINGDRLPCDITSISESEMMISTGYAGPLTIPRKNITTVQLGIRPRKTIYSGPEDLNHWDVGNNWHFEDGALVSDGSGSVSREFKDLPDSFSFSLQLKWADKPMFKVFFSSDSSTSSGGNHDRYFMQVGSAGIEIKRQSSGKNSYHSLIVVNRSIDTFKDRKANFEIRFDHRQQRLLLYIDGQLEGQATDPLPMIPEGKTVVFRSDASKAEAHRVSSILLREWDAAGERHRSEDRGDFGEDALINNKGERFGGRLQESKVSKNAMTFLFKSPLAPEALQIPAAEVSTLFFEKTDTEESATPPLVLGLSGSGTIGARSCTFGPDKVELTHPLLGPLKLNRDVVMMLQRRPWPESQEPPTYDEE
ncbi:hypothetical protein [Haloferula sp.]|uniref:hypothetical protein n=1 Tax=Haloferula sp. TaxID=2497595 RepID=UPI00329E2807